MKTLNPLYTIGAIGMVITASLHMLFSTMLARPLLHITFLVLYPILIACLAIGHYKMVKAEKAATTVHL
jgi:hypothetical protein